MDTQNCEKARPRFLSRIDWELLKKQKLRILRMSRTSIDVKNGQALEGIISLIDSIQDYAVDVMGISEEEIFNLDLKEIDK